MRSRLAQKARSSVNEVDKQMALATVLVEKELNVGPITEDYLLMKFFIQLEMLKEIKEKENEAYKGTKGANTFK